MIRGGLFEAVRRFQFHRRKLHTVIILKGSRKRYYAAPINISRCTNVKQELK
jgi:hypothetical protein